MPTTKYTLNLDLPQFYETLSQVSGSLTGEFGVHDLEKRVMDLAVTSPFLQKILGAIGEAQRRIDAIRDQPLQEDPEIFQQFLHHVETFCCLQGSLATLILVTETLQKDQVSRAPERKRKKSP